MPRSPALVLAIALLALPLGAGQTEAQGQARAATAAAPLASPLPPARPRASPLPQAQQQAPQARQPAPPPRQAALPVTGDGGLRRALAQGRAGNWAQAAATAAAAGPVAVAVVEWHRLRAGEGDWRDVARFAAAHPDWPGLAQKRARGEESLSAAWPGAQAVIDWFGGRAPATGDGVVTLVRALVEAGRRDEAERVAVRAWREMVLSEGQEAALLARFGAALAAHHGERLDMLLWRNARAAAERQAARMGGGHRALAAARLGLRARADGVNALIAAVPASLAGDPGLAFERFDWRMDRQLHDSAAELLLERSAAGTLGRPEAWARGRTFLARQALASGDARRAYRLAAGHGLDDGAQFADLEWFAGWVALRWLNDPGTALRHFERLRVRVGSPISLARAGYWEGRAHEVMGNAEAARLAFAFAAEHQTAFYGLLAAERAGIAMSPLLAGDPPAPSTAAGRIAREPLLQAALLLRAAGEWHTARTFFLALAGRLDAAELAALGDLALEIGEPNWAVNVSKQAANREIVLVRAGFPLTWLDRADLPVPNDLVLAIARRESEFDPAVVSPADARGLMQVLPGTGAMMARRLDIAFDPARLTTDPVFNARLGAAYLRELKSEFGPSLALVAAGYNAGPGRPRAWVQERGDPRGMDHDALIDWIERVPFAETRNYIMRVAESLYVYRARLNGGPVPIRLTDALRGR
jgi:soluble lytic murein transglycosylase